ncbi:tetratricopeptide repeat protein [Umezawaea endophytica]|uniref:Tetratricopeptide repeat protein n=2 Tax=Umezawaea endophytica TaxID=1654476 RepID=A0A9X2VJW6_9PSEU|nr:tetratricopeptide repeat protein [Umezawaea endophytica]MCS7477881.1 tetratricopeptide repeat protein [Umezawaea endophytica]
MNSGPSGFVGQFGEVHGDVTIGGTPAAYAVERWRPWIRSPGGGGPSRMLVAENQVVTFTGRERELDDLARWRDADPGAQGLLLHGPGGQGKTRLAAEFAQRSARLGWEVVAARHGVGKRVAAADEPKADEVGTLVVVDYAERWPTTDLLRLATDPVVASRPRTRFLFVARPAGHWWWTLAQQLAETGLDAGRAVPVPPLGTGPDQRRALFETARDRFAEELGVGRVDGIGMPEWLDRDSRDHVLTIHMAAWAAVDAHVSGADAPGDLASLSGYLITRERTHWQKMHGSGRRFTTPESVMAGVVFVAALTGAQPSEHAAELVVRTAFAKDAKDATVVLGDHALCYPPSDPRADFVLEPIYPDRLAEDLVGLYTPGGDIGFPAETWAGTVLRRVLDEDSGPRHLRHALIHLIEAADRWPHLAREHLFPVLRGRPALVLHAGGAALTRLAELPALGVDLLTAIERTLPEVHLDLSAGLVALTERLVRETVGPDSDPVEVAALLRRLSRRLLEVGRADDGFAALQRAEVTLREVVWEDPRRYLPELARTLTDYAAHLADLGRFEEAIAVGEDAHWLRLNASGDGGEPGEETAADVAATRGTLSALLTDVGRPAAALPVVDDAIRLLRRGATVDPGLFRPDLARALVQQGRVLWALGRWERAAGASAQGVLLWRLVLDEPDPGDGNDRRPDLALALHNHAKHLADAERWDEAVDAATESVELLRHAADKNPKVYLAPFAAVLDHLAGLRRTTGDWPAARATADQVVEVRREDGDRSELAESLVILAFREAELYHPRSALRSASQATHLAEGLVADDPVRHGALLGWTYLGLASAHATLGDQEAAVAAAVKAVALDRRYAADDPVGVGTSLGDLAEHLLAAGRFDEALAAVREATDLVERRDGVHRLNRAVTLLWVRQVEVTALVGLGRFVEANDLAERAVGQVAVVRRRFLVDGLLTLARTLDARSTALAGIGRSAEAVAAAEEAVDVLRDLAADGTDHRGALAARLTTLAQRYAERGWWTRACDAGTEAVASRRGLVAGAECDATRLLLARSLWQHAHLRVAAGVEIPAAVDAAVEAIGLYDRCAHAPARERRSAVITLARALTAAGRAADAARTLRDSGIPADAVPDVPAEW